MATPLEQPYDPRDRIHRRMSALHDRIRRPHILGQSRELPHLAIGIFMTLLGVVLTLDRLELVDAARALRWWPVGFHVLGATLLLRRPDRHGQAWGVGWLVLGTWLLLNSLNIVRVGFWELIWPGLLIFIGVRMMMRGGQPAVAADGQPVTATPNLMAVLSEARNAVTQPLATASLTSVMGGCHLDLRQAAGPAGGPITVDVFGLMGGHEIIVPSGWTVVFDVVTILAAAEDKRLPSVAAAADPRSTQVLTIRGTLIFSGLTIKN
jgi:hypothetical protein